MRSGAPLKGEVEKSLERVGSSLPKTCAAARLVISDRAVLAINSQDISLSRTRAATA